MKSIDAGLFAANLDECLAASRDETIVLTREGKPCAVVHGVDYDEQQLALAGSTSFWEMIAERRAGKMIPWNEAKASTGL